MIAECCSSREQNQLISFHAEFKAPGWIKLDGKQNADQIYKSKNWPFETFLK